MIRKISILIFVSVILVCGYVSIKKLNYWERSISVFKVNSSALFFEGRGRGFGEPGDRERFEGRPGQRAGDQRGTQMPVDSLSPRLGGRGRGGEGRSIIRTDSLRSGRADRAGNPAVRRSFDGRMREIDGPGGRDGRGGRIISMRNVIYFLGVFAFFTVIVIYLEKIYWLVKRKRIPDIRR
jgi:hypothetical protein